MSSLLDLKATPSYWHLRAALRNQVQKENISPNPRALQQLVRQKHLQPLLQGLLTPASALAPCASAPRPSPEEGIVRFYRGKWTEILLRNFAAVCEGNEQVVFSWSSLYNFLHLTRDELIYDTSLDKASDSALAFLAGDP